MATDPMVNIRKKAKTEEIDYLFLMDCLSSYQNPRAKVTALLKSHRLIRVKKGLYIFGEEDRRRPYSLEVLANLIYGPSYISFESALAYYRLIPETAIRVTSACCKRVKRFSTPVGEFVYSFISPEKFPVGVTWQALDEWTHFLIATKEKALADTLARTKCFASSEDLFRYLVEGMRIDPEDLARMKLTLIQDIARAYQNKNVDFLCNLLKK